MGKVVPMPYRKLVHPEEEEGVQHYVELYPGYLGHEIDGDRVFEDNGLELLSQVVEGVIEADAHDDFYANFSGVLHTRVKSIDVYEDEYIGYTPRCWFLAEGYTLEQMREEVRQLAELIESERKWIVCYRKTPVAVGTEDNPQLEEDFVGWAAACEFAEKILASADYESGEIVITDYFSMQGPTLIKDGDNWVRQEGWVPEGGWPLQG
ncbi:MAG: hypothetical protein QGG67_01435 [Gammaproteobacteria bacterium]|jgi:hypothetical protein|nr:hypothetical protein [Gammaproteobacteria bacterium]